MAEISAAQVKDLRDKTGAGMMDCKNALIEAGGNYDTALENLRKQGIVKAEKKSGRSTKQGLVQIAGENKSAAVVEVLCETDFVAKNDKFKEYVTALATKALKFNGEGDISAGIQEMEKATLAGMIATIGENMQIRRCAKWVSKHGICSSYIHLGGKLGVMIDVSGENLNDVALKDICMHIAAFRPTYISPDDVPAQLIEKEKEIAASQVDAGKKPKEVVEKILSGKIAKWFTEVCLMKQPWLRDDKLSVEKANPGIKIHRFLRWETGEEI